MCDMFYLKKFRLKSCEGTSDSQIKFLSCIHAFRFVLIRRYQIVHSHFDILVSDGRELRAIDNFLSVRWSPNDVFDFVYYFETNVLPFFVAIEPKNDI